MAPGDVALWLWMAFLASWYVAMFWTARAVSHGARGPRLLYALGFAIGFGLLFSARAPRSQPFDRFWRAPRPVDWALIAAELAAFAFAWWARAHLGRLWSGMMTLREGHRIVDSGPYRLVRHPIYTGFIGAGWAYALILASPLSLGGALILTLVMTVKAKAEERLLRRELGARDYDAYAAITPMIVPFAPR